MTEIHIHNVRCDGCDKEIHAFEADGWWSVHEIVGTPERYKELVMEAQEKGISGAISGDFCSLPCLASWATNAGTLKSWENKPTFDPEFKPEFPWADLPDEGEGTNT